MEGVCRSHYFAVFCITQPTASSQQFDGYGVVMKGDYRVMGNADVLSTEYKAYQGTVYEPFNDTPPSESGNSNSGPKGISGRKNGFINPSDPGEEQTGEGSPVGEPWILLLFAAVAAVVVAWRQKRKAQV